MTYAFALSTTVLVSSVLAAPAGAGSTLAYVDQVDTSAAATAGRSAHAAATTAMFAGLDNLVANVGVTSPDPAGDLALIDQKGDRNSATLMQDGLQNVGLITQVGLLNDAIVAQSGHGHRAFVIQRGQGNVAVISQR